MVGRLVRVWGVARPPTPRRLSVTLSSSSNCYVRALAKNAEINVCAVKLTSSTWTRWIDLVFIFFRYTFQASKMLTCVSWLSHRNEKNLAIFTMNYEKSTRFWDLSAHTTSSAAAQCSMWRNWMNREKKLWQFLWSIKRASFSSHQSSLPQRASECAQSLTLTARDRRKKSGLIAFAMHRGISAANSVRTVRWLDRIITVKSAGQLSLRYGSMLWVTRASIGQEMQGERKVLANN